MHRSIDLLPVKPADNAPVNEIIRKLLPRKLAEIQGLYDHLQTNLPEDDRRCLEDNFGII